MALPIRTRAWTGRETLQEVQDWEMGVKSTAGLIAEDFEGPTCPRLQSCQAPTQGIFGSDSTSSKRS